MKKIPDKIMEEIIKLKGANHSYKDISEIMKKKKFSLERHTIAKICQSATTSDGASVNNKPPQIYEGPYRNIKEKALRDAREHAKAMKDILNEELLREEVNEIMREAGICPCEICKELSDNEEKLEKSVKVLQQRIVELQQNLREEQAMNEASKNDSLLIQRVVLLEDALRDRGYKVEFKY